MMAQLKIVPFIEKIDVFKFTYITAFKFTYITAFIRISNVHILGAKEGSIIKSQCNSIIRRWLS